MNVQNGSAKVQENLTQRKRRLSQEQDTKDDTPGLHDLARNETTSLCSTADDLTPSRKRVRCDTPHRSMSHDECFTSKKHEPLQLSLLPPEIIQHILSFVDSISLGRCLCVNKTFNTLLNPNQSHPRGSGRKGLLTPQHPMAVWVSSRKQCHPGFPRPLYGKPELEMWKLVRGLHCQFCGRKPGSRAPVFSPSPWNAGPGPDGVRVIWPFGVRTCGACLESRVVKEAEVLFSPFSILLPALPFAFFTPSFNFVPSILLRHTSPPPGLQLTKYFFRPQYEEMKAKLEEAKSLGLAAAEEWYKGLERLGQDRVTDASRFEHWDAAGDTKASSIVASARCTPVSGLPDLPSALALSTQQQYHHQAAINRNQSPLLPHPPPGPLPFVPPAPGTTRSLPMKPVTPAPGQYVANTLASPIPSIATFQYRHPQSRPERSIRDVTQMKAARRAEIERRCVQISPPLLPSTLLYMDVFAAAIQIPMALNDKAWEVLKPRLLAQRKEAEAKEEEQRAANTRLQAKAEEPRQNEEQFKFARENLERDCNEMQRPVRDKIAKYADEIIGADWRGGAAVRYENAPEFAAEVLVHIRRRFYETHAHEDPVLSSQQLPVRQNTPSGASARILKLEHMKWVYDIKIKPIAEQFRKDLFLCNACDYNNYKYYAMDAVIQHYAAKHTSALSHGTAVVYWKAEWPAEPPFDVQPRTRSSRADPEHSFGATSPLYSETGLSSVGGPLDRLALNSRNGPCASSDGTPLHQSFPNAFAVERDQTANFVSQATTAYSPAISHASAKAGYCHGANPSRYEAVDERTYLAALPTHPLPQHGRHRQTALSDPISSQPYIRKPTARLPGQPSGIYHTQMEDLSCTARDIWDGTADVPTLPNGLRIYVVIHHVAHRFSEKYTNEPNLTLFLDSLNNNSRMKPLKDASALSCKACSDLSRPKAGLGAARDIEIVYNLPDLLMHFQITHIQSSNASVAGATGAGMLRTDWKVDMIVLPDTNVIRDLISARGMTFYKLSLIAAILPQCFPMPLPKIEPISLLPGVAQGQPGISVDTRDEFGIQHTMKGSSITERPRRPHAESILTGAPRYIDEVSLGRHPAFEPAEEDEYDPHRPAPTNGTMRRTDNASWVSRRQPGIVYSRRLANPGRYGDEHVTEPYHSVDPRPAETAYRFRDYSTADFDTAPVRRFLPREDIERVSPDPQMGRYYSPIDPLRDRKSAYSPRRSLSLPHEEDDASNKGVRVKQEKSRAFNHECVNAAEHFLNNFDNIGNDPYVDTNHGLQSKRANEGSYPVDNIDTFKQTSSLGHGMRPEPDRPQSQPVDGEKIFDHPSLIQGGRGRSRSPVLQLSYQRDDRMMPERRLTRWRKVRDLREFDRHDGARRQGLTRVIEYDRDGLPLHSPELVSPQLESLRYHRGQSPLLRYDGRHAFAPPFLEDYLPRAVEGQMRYTEVTPSSQYKYVEEQREIDGEYEQVEYVRVAPLEMQTHGRYYVDRPLRGDVPVRLDSSGHDRRELPYEQDTQPYAAGELNVRRYGVHGHQVGID